ncbi:MAG: hypothetical protein COB14_09520 [Alphaproteobacteria bacterium]|nr:MAG: hypothetical protein COB14_09520 [Alphaproteobacteria bacterium]
MSKQYSETFKKRAIEKALTRGHDVSVDQISNDIDVASGTLYHRIRKSRKTSVTKRDAPKKRHQDWCEAEKLDAIIETSTLDAENLNFYYHRNGVYKHHIEQWKADMASTQGHPREVAPEIRRVC